MKNSLIQKVFLFLTLFSVPAFSYLGKNPIVLVHGYGPLLLVNMGKYKSFLVRDGVQPKDILLLDYPQLASPENITADVKAKLLKFLSAYPEDTKIDIITHSYGNFIGLYAPLEAGLGDRVENFVGLAGVARGMNQTTVCRFLGCGKTIPLLKPYMNSFVRGYLEKYAPQIKNYKKCALYSNADSVVNDPPNSCALPGGRNVEVLNASHMSFITDEDLYDIMKTACFGETAPAVGFTHRWRYR